MKNNTVYWLLLLLLSLLPLIDLLQSGLPVTHDGQDHVARIANFYRNLEDGILVPRWAGNLNWGYGHPILMFLYPIPSYMGSLFHFFGFSFVDSVKLVFAVSFVLSGVAMYQWIKTVWGKEAGLVAAVLYLFAPYRFVDLYVRGAIGEHVAFIFPPLVMLFLYKLSQKISFKYIVLGSLSLAGFILAHNAISIMFMPIIILYGIYLGLSAQSRSRFFVGCVTLLFLGYGLSAFFWMPAFFEGKYTLRDIVTKNEYASRFVPIKDLLYGQWSYGGTGQLTTQVGIVHWIAVLASVGVLFKTAKKNKSMLLTIGLLVSFFGVLFLMTEYSKTIWQFITTLQKFQFPWRFLSVTVFLTSILGAVFVQQVQKKYQAIVVIIFIVLAIFLTKDYWRAQEYIKRPDTFYSSIYNGTTDTGESAPIWSVRFMEHTPKANIEIIDGEGVIQEMYRSSTNHTYTINTTQRSRIRENTVYFPGWEVRVNGKPVLVEFQDPANRGLITFFVEKGEHTIELGFKETKLRMIANSIAVASLVILFAYSILKAPLWRRFRLF